MRFSLETAPPPQLSEGLSLTAASPRTHGCHGDRRGFLLCPLRRKSRPSWYKLGKTVVNTFAACSGHQAMTKYFEREGGGEGAETNTMILLLLAAAAAAKSLQSCPTLVRPHGLRY